LLLYTDTLRKKLLPSRVTHKRDVSVAKKIFPKPPLSKILAIQSEGRGNKRKTVLPVRKKGPKSPKIIKEDILVIASPSNLFVEKEMIINAEIRPCNTPATEIRNMMWWLMSDNLKNSSAPMVIAKENPRGIPNLDRRYPLFLKGVMNKYPAVCSSVSSRITIADTKLNIRGVIVARSRSKRA